MVGADSRAMGRARIVVPAKLLLSYDPMKMMPVPVGAEMLQCH
jgi:hypothetical protein